MVPPADDDHDGEDDFFVDHTNISINEMILRNLYIIIYVCVLYKRYVIDHVNVGRATNAAQD